MRRRLVGIDCTSQNAPIWKNPARKYSGQKLREDYGRITKLLSQKFGGATGRSLVEVGKFAQKDHAGLNQSVPCNFADKLTVAIYGQ